LHLANPADLLKNHPYVPTLVIQGDDDQIVPIGASGLISSKIVKGATLKIYSGAPHGLCSTLKEPGQRRPPDIHQDVGQHRRTRTTRLF
jgi:fermentation-respiration switch protein FrsA (DUF1100 family)